MKYNFTFTLLFVLFLSFFNITSNTLANTSSGENFVVNINMPKNQYERTGSYYDLDASNLNNQKLSFDIRNRTEKKIKVGLEPSNALNNANGGINYTLSEGTESSKLIDEKFLMEQYIKTPKSINLKPKETKTIEFKVNYPDVKTGTLLGGVLFKDITEQPDKDEVESNGVNITQEVLIGYAIRADFGDVEGMKSDVSLEGNSVGLTPSGLQLLFHLTNNVANIPNDIYFEYEVYDNKKNLLFKDDVSKFKLAPKSELNFPIFWPNNDYIDGVYTIKTTLYIDGENKDYEYKIKIDENKLTKAKDEEPIYIDWPENNNLKWIILGALFFAFVSSYIIIKRKKGDKREKAFNNNTRNDVDE